MQISDVCKVGACALFGILVRQELTQMAALVWHVASKTCIPQHNQ